MQLRRYQPEDAPALLALNAESVHFLSPLDAAAFERLLAHSAYRQVIEDDAGVAALVLAFAPGADYDSPNYRWFETRGGHFLYVDRVVVAKRAQGRGLGRALYAALFEFAHAEGYAELVCEFDIDPPNPVSAAFHAGFGFRELGQHQANGKRVSMQAAGLTGR
jgi:hypothetical protein